MSRTSQDGNRAEAMAEEDLTARDMVGGVDSVSSSSCVPSRRRRDGCLA
eukprot:CAMPEP_0119515460 /NCGR_PEP_ID=MMETSP1344-20130328/32946_1 /TAXON_ID=236787 /ORGANISM="Florenciella parvula, Strain CCMP2471" /LENGTH=48 /DNA_ID= /DNA_START= /DNA_END= /DNA_ORIENTATION=